MTATSSVAFLLSLFVSLTTSTPYEAECAREGYTNWSRPIYKKGEMVKWECWDSQWRRKEVIIAGK